MSGQPLEPSTLKLKSDKKAEIWCLHWHQREAQRPQNTLNSERKYMFCCLTITQMKSSLEIQIWLALRRIGVLTSQWIVGTHKIDLRSATLWVLDKSKKCIPSFGVECIWKQPIRNNPRDGCDKSHYDVTGGDWPGPWQYIQDMSETSRMQMLRYIRGNLLSNYALNALWTGIPSYHQ